MSEPTTRDAQLVDSLSATRDAGGPTDTAPMLAGEAGRYALADVVGHGGLGQVWRATDHLLRRDVALKEPLHDPANRAEQLAALRHEAWAIGQLQHPNVVPILDLICDAGGEPVAYTMPLLDGSTLREWAVAFHADRPTRAATRRRLLPLLDAFRGVCRGIEHAHGRGLLHLDLKGANVKLGPLGDAVVIDWGLAQSTAGNATGRAGGTPPYMAPEQVRGEPLDVRTDVYGLGAILYECLTGKPPFAGGRPRDVMDKVKTEPPAPVRRHLPGVPAALEHVCMRAVSKSPAARYPSAAALNAAIDAWVADEPIPERAEPWGERIERRVRRYRWPVAVAAAVLLTAVPLLVWGLVAKSREQAATAAALRTERAAVRHVLDAGELFFNQIGESRLLQVDGMQPLRRELMERGVVYYEQFFADRGDDPEVLSQAVMARIRAGYLLNQLGELSRATAMFVAGRSGAVRLVAAQPGDRHNQRMLATLECGLALARLSLDSLSALDAETARFTTALGDAQPAAEDANIVASLWATRGRVCELNGVQPDAGRAFATAVSWARRAAASAPDNDVIQSHFAVILLQHGSHHRSYGDRDEARRAFEEARPVYERLAAKPSFATDARSRLSACDLFVGLLLYDAGHVVDAIPYYERALAQRERLAQDNPAVPQFSGDLANCQRNLSLVYQRLGRFDAAMPYAVAAHAWAERLLSARDSLPGDLGFAATAVQTLAELHAARGDWPRAVELSGQSAAVITRLRARPVSADPSLDGFAARASLGRAILMARAGRWADAATAAADFQRFAGRGRRR